MHASYLWKGILPHAAPVAGWGRLEFWNVKRIWGRWIPSSSLIHLETSSSAVGDNHIQDSNTDCKMRIHWTLAALQTTHLELLTVLTYRVDLWKVYIWKTNSYCEPNFKEFIQPVPLEGNIFMLISTSICIQMIIVQITNDLCTSEQACLGQMFPWLFHIWSGITLCLAMSQFVPLMNGLY